MIKTTRGDTLKLKFKRKNSEGEVITTLPDKMWFTVKENAYSEEILIQKTLENGIEFDTDTYHIMIESDDTKNLCYGLYEYDIQIKVENAIKTISKGKLAIEEEITFEVE